LTGLNDLLLIIWLEVREVTLFDSGSQLKEQGESHYPDRVDAQIFIFNKISFQKKEDPSGKFRFKVLFKSPPLVLFCSFLKKI